MVIGGLLETCQYLEPYPTNNVSESYNAGLRRRIFCGKPQLYQLIQKLWREVEFIPSRLIPYDEGFVNVNDRRRFEHKRKLEICWFKLDKGFITPQTFLKIISKYKFVKASSLFARKDSRVDLQPN